MAQLNRLWARGLQRHAAECNPWPQNQHWGWGKEGLGGEGGAIPAYTPPHPSGCKPPVPSPLCHSGPDPKAPAALGSSGRGPWHVPVVPGPAPHPTHRGDPGGAGGPPHQDRSRRPCKSCRVLCRLNPGCRGSPSRRCPGGTGGGGGPNGQAVGWAPPPGRSPRPAAPRAPGMEPGWEKQPHRARTDGRVSWGGGVLATHRGAW